MPVEGMLNLQPTRYNQITLTKLQHSIGSGINFELNNPRSNS